MANVPQGLTDQQFSDLSTKVRTGVAHLGNDVAVHGSRAAGTARPDSDLDIAIRVSAQRFEELIVECFGTPNPGSAKEKTMLNARETGKIQCGEAGLRKLRKLLETDLGVEIDISVICHDGLFDQGPYMPLR